MPLFPVEDALDPSSASGVPLPIIRYFVFVGSLLLALLFAADRYLSRPPDAIRSAEVDRTIIRIHSARTPPEKIVFDTSQRMAAPSSIALNDERTIDDSPQVAAEAAPPVQAEKTVVTPGRHVAERQRMHSRRAVRDRRFAFDQRNLFAGW